MKDKNYRVIAIHDKWKANGEWNEERTQHLQKRIIPGLWKTIDTEIVPSFAWLHHAVFGDAPDWKSKFKDYL